MAVSFRDVQEILMKEMVCHSGFPSVVRSGGRISRVAEAAETCAGIYVFLQCSLLYNLRWEESLCALTMAAVVGVRAGAQPRLSPYSVSGHSSLSCEDNLSQ